MSFDLTIKALDSKFRREIMKSIYNNPLTVNELMAMFNKKSLKIKYRTSLYRELEKLVEAKLINKEYFKNKGICYSTKIRNIEIELINDNISFK